jgi:ABC-2 type transport system ATP-binding protein
VATVFLQLVDVGPNGDEETIYHQVAPAKVSDSGQVTFTLAGIVHRFPAGPRLRLVIKGSDPAFRSDPAQPDVQFDTRDSALLTLPTIQ